MNRLSLSIEPLPTILITFDRSSGTNNDIYGICLVNNGDSFQPEFLIVGEAGTQTHSTTAFKDSRTHLTWGDYPSTTIYYKPSFNDGATFGATETVTGGIVGLADATDNYLHCLGATYRRRFLPPPDTTPPTVPTNLIPTPGNERIDLI